MSEIPSTRAAQISQVRERLRAELHELHHGHVRIRDDGMVVPADGENDCGLCLGIDAGMCLDGWNGIPHGPHGKCGGLSGPPVNPGAEPVDQD